MNSSIASTSSSNRTSASPVPRQRLAVPHRASPRSGNGLRARRWGHRKRRSSRKIDRFRVGGDKEKALFRCWRWSAGRARRPPPHQRATVRFNVSRRRAGAMIGHEQAGFESKGADDRHDLPDGGVGFEHARRGRTSGEGRQGTKGPKGKQSPQRQAEGA
jgi:hypothetical protein